MLLPGSGTAWSCGEPAADGKRVGEIRFPAGEVDISSVCRPGATHLLSLLVVAMPLKGVRLSFNDSNAAREVKGSVARRGLCGNVYLDATPAAARIGDVKIDTVDPQRRDHSPRRLTGTLGLVRTLGKGEHTVFWKLRRGMERNRRLESTTDWQRLQRPGFIAEMLPVRS